MNTGPMLHLALYAQPDQVPPGRPVELDGQLYETVDVRGPALTRPLPITFEEIVDALEQLPQAYVEQDGSFALHGSSGAKRWQISGVLYDRGDRVHYVEIWASRHRDALQTFLPLLGWPDQPLLCHFVQQAFFLSDEELLRYLRQGE